MISRSSAKRIPPHRGIHNGIALLRDPSIRYPSLLFAPVGLFLDKQEPLRPLLYPEEPKGYATFSVDGGFEET